MRTLDLTPLYRSAVGFDRLAGLLETAARTGETSGWPPYNIEKTGDFKPVMGVTLLIGLNFMVANLIVDLLYGVLDPRLRVSTAKA